MKYKKIVAIVTLGIILIIIAGVIVLFFRSAKTDVIANLSLKGLTIPVVLSIEYIEQTDRDIQTPRILSMVILLNPNTKKIGILEIPAYTGIHNSKSVVPIDQKYRNGGYGVYFDQLRKILDSPQIQHIFIKYQDLASVIDLLGGLEVFLISEEFSTIDDSLGEYGSGIGNVYFDGLGIKEYINTMENSTEDELLKSIKRKELITAILEQIQKEHDYNNNAVQLFVQMKKQVKTSLSINGLKNFFLILADYQIVNLYFQRLTGQLRKISIGSDKNILKDNNDISTILFTSTEVGVISQVLKSLEDKLVRETVDRIHDKITISILNGTVVNGLASETKEIYEATGFQVLFIGNASNTDVKTTTLIDRIGNKINANFAAQIIGVRSIITDITSVDQAGSELTLILGKDFNGETVENE